MTLAKIIGTVVSSRRADGMDGPSYLLAQECDRTGTPDGGISVVLDPLGTGRGEFVLVARGSSVRWTDLTTDRPIDALIVGQVEMIDEGGTLTYRRSASAGE